MLCRKQLTCLLLLLLIPALCVARAEEDEPVAVQVGRFCYPLSMVQGSLDSAIRLAESLNGVPLSEEDRAGMARDVIDNFVGIGLIEAKLTEAGRHDFTAEEEEQIHEAARERYEELWQGVYQMLKKNGSDATEARVAEALEEEGYTLDAIYQEYLVSERQRRAIALYVSSIALTQAELDDYYETQFLAPERERYQNDIPRYEREILAGDNESFYTPAGYRYFRQILLEYPAEVTDALKPYKKEVEKAANAVADAYTSLAQAAATVDDWTELDEPRAAYDRAVEALDAVNRVYAEKRRALTLPALQDRIDEIDRRLGAGIDFLSLISVYSADTTDQNVSGTGYPMHPESQGWPADFIDAVMSLEKPGDVSGPVLTEKGVHILYYDSDAPAGDHVLTDEEMEVLKESALYYYQTQALVGLFDEWKPDFDIETHPELLKY